VRFPPFKLIVTPFKVFTLFFLIIVKGEDPLASNLLSIKCRISSSFPLKLTGNSKVIGLLYKWLVCRKAIFIVNIVLLFASNIIKRVVLL